MTKEEKIIEAWGNEFETYKPNEDGWSSKIIYDWNNFEFKEFDTKLVGHGMYKVRPELLKGIENNNGWIKIESEADFPKDYTCCWFIVLGVVKNGLFNSKSFLETEVGNIYYGGVTHYQSIPKPEPPIY